MYLFCFCQKKLKQKKGKKNKVDQEEQEMLSKKYHISGDKDVQNAYDLK